MNLRPTHLVTGLALGAVAMVAGYGLWTTGASSGRTAPAVVPPAAVVPPPAAAPSAAPDEPAPIAATAASAPASSPQALGPADADVEEAEMEALRTLEKTDPERALALARAANARDPDGRHAPERAKIVVKSLALLHRYSEARGEAETMVNRYAGTKWALEVEQHTGAHPRVDRR